MSTIDSRELRNAFGSFMTGVTVVTAVSDSGEKVGFTANSFTSVSVDPALLLVCPSNKLSSFEVFNSCRHFAVNILAEDQQDISNTFASGKGDRFADIAWHADEHGCPIIDGCVAHFSCSTYNTSDAGDHILLIGQIQQFATNDKPGLGYSRGGYFSLGMEHKAEEVANLVGKVGAIVEYRNQLLLQKTEQGYTLPQVPTCKDQGSKKTLQQYLQQQGLNCRVDAVYSIYENPAADAFSSFYRAVAEDDNCGEQGEYVNINELKNIQFASTDLQSMLGRYVHEKHNGVFRLYIGDQNTGDIH